VPQEKISYDIRVSHLKEIPIVMKMLYMKIC